MSNKTNFKRSTCNCRCTLKQEEEEERRNADMLYENIREKLRRKEDEYKKEVETKQVELALRTLNMELKAAKNQVNQFLIKTVFPSILHSVILYIYIL